jgi:hypothetical protein
VLLGLFAGVGVFPSLVFVCLTAFLQWISSTCFQKAEKKGGRILIANKIDQ